jgi:hypothetical protein
MNFHEPRISKDTFVVAERTYVGEAAFLLLLLLPPPAPLPEGERYSGTTNSGTRVGGVGLVV